MKSGAKAMYAIGAFMLLMTIIYILATNFVQEDGYLGKVEWAGITGLALATGLSFMLGGYLHFTEVRCDILPEDWEEAEVSDKAGTLGFFSPGSIWPAAMAGSIAVLGLGIAFFHYWMIVLGAALLVFSVAKLNLQYGLPKESH